MEAGVMRWTPRSCSRKCSCCISKVRLVKALYSASKLDLETVGCFFDLQEMREYPRKTKKINTK